MKIHDTALKHGIDPEDIMRAAAWPLWIEDLDDAPASLSEAGCPEGVGGEGEARADPTLIRVAS